MGITGLIPFLEKASSRVHLKDLRGSTVAVDTYCWLHKGIYSCAEKLMRGEETDQYLLYCLKYVSLLLSYDIKPILVFDGQHLPAKALTERRRRVSRQQSKKRAAELLRLGRIEEARSHMRRCVDVTHEMALRLIRECRQRNVDCIVAPFEADAQMAWLNIAGLAQYIVTEDSDLTLFGARKVIFKLDLSGAGLLVEADKLYLAMGCREEKYTFDKFRRMCILSGCDYLDSLPGIGLAKACKFMLKTEEDDMERALRKIPQYLNMRNLEVDDQYIENFLKAEATFKHMYIFNPTTRKTERLNALENADAIERYCCNAGVPLEDDGLAMQLALGNLNPFTLKTLDNWHPDRDYAKAQPRAKAVQRAKHKSIWLPNVQAPSITTLKDVPNGNNSTPSCALYFKKVDFISKTIDEEISANWREECAKPVEEEILSMYQMSAVVAAEDASVKKRKRSENNEGRTPPPSPSSAQKRHNPFAKAPDSAEQLFAKSSAQVGENASLLKVLSPKKYGQELVRPYGTQSIEVKSRFFAANHVQASSSKQNASAAPAPDLSEEFDKIERLSQQQQSFQAELYAYDSPSPQKKSAFAMAMAAGMLEKKPSYADSGIESQSNDNDEENDKDIACDDDLATASSIPDTEAKKFISNEEEKEGNKDVIYVSDDSSTGNGNNAPSSSMIIRPLDFAPFKSQSARRLGLRKPPSVKKKTAHGVTKSSKVVSGAASVSQNQPQLSMFGFQKRPILK